MMSNGLDVLIPHFTQKRHCECSVGFLITLNTIQWQNKDLKTLSNQYFSKYLCRKYTETKSKIFKNSDNNNDRIRKTHNSCIETNVSAENIYVENI